MGKSIMAANAIEKVEIIGSSKGLDELADDLNRVADAQDNVADASKTTAAVTERSSRSVAAATRAYERVSAQVDAAYRSERQYAQGKAALDKAFQQQIIDATVYAQRIDQLSAKYAKLDAANDNLVGGARHASSVFDRLRSSVGLAGDQVAQAQGKFANAAAVLTQFRGLAAGAAGAVGLGGGLAISGIVSTTAEFERLKGSLQTVTGSAQAADRAMAFVKDFAKKTPFDVQQVTEAFIRLKLLGLDPSAEALTSYGNTASAMGRPLMQFIEAIADATTGEFERLKEFGIKAAQDGDKVSLTFKGQTTTIRNSAADIEGYLRRIGDVNFAGGMDRQAASLGGALSNVQDSVANFQDAIGRGGLASALADAARETSALLDANHDLAALLGGAMGDFIRDTRGLMSELGAAATHVKGRFAEAGDAILDVVAGIAASGHAAVVGFMAAWDNFPDLLRAVGVAAFNTFLRLVQRAINDTVSEINRLVGVVNSIGSLVGAQPIELFAPVDFAGMKQEYTGAAADIAGSVAGAYESNRTRIREALSGMVGGDAPVGDELAAKFGGVRIAADAAVPAIAATGEASSEAGKKAERAAQAFEDQRRSVADAAADIQRQIDTFDASEGATARLEFTTRELAKAWDIAREAGLSAIPAETLRAIEAAAGQIETLTDKLQAMRTVRSAVDEFFPFEKAARDAADLQAVLDNTSLSLTETERTAVQLKIDKGFTDAAKAADDLRGKGTKAAEDIGASFMSNVGDVFSDIFGQATRDGQSFFDSVLQGLAGLGSQLAAAGAKNLFGKLFGLPQDAKTQSAAGIGGLIGQGAGYTAANQNTATGSRYGAIASAPLSALNDNLAKTSRSAMDVAKQFAGLNERADTKVLDGFLRASGQWKGLSASDTAWCAAFANAAIAQTGGQGTGSNLASSFMNWGMGTSAPKAGDIVVLKPQARGASGHVGFVAGFGDGTVQVFGGNQSGGANTKSFGLDQVRSYRTANGNASAAVQPANASAAYAPLSRRDLSAGVTDGLKTYQDRYAPSYGDYTARGVDPWQGANGQSLRGVSFGQTAMGALGAGAGIFAQGYQSGSPLMGLASGAMGGFQAGSALFPALGMAGPIGAGIGALVGIAGGILGKRAERKKAHQEAAAKWEGMRPQYEAFDQSLSGDTKGGLRTWITDQWNQLSGFMSMGGAAWKNGTGNSTAQFRSTGTKLFERFHEMIREFQDGYVSMIHDMESGEGLQGAFAKGRNATKDLKKQIQATRDDIDIAFGNVADIGFLNTPDAVAQAKASEEARSIAIERYNKAAGEYALSLMYTSVQVSDVRKTIDGFRGTAAGLHDVFADLGWSAEDAASAINDRLNLAIANVAKGLNEGIRDRIEELAGVGYFSSVRTFLAEFDTLKADVAAAGADPSQLSDLFGRELQAIVDGAELTGTAFTDLIAMFPQLAGVVREFTETAVAASAAEIKSAIESYGERLFQTQHVGDELALFDRKAAQERLEAARFGADGVAALEAALAAERLNIVRTQAQALASNRYEAAVSARAEAESALRAEYERTVDYVDGIRGYLSDMRLDDNLSTLSGREQFNEAQRLYRETLFKANGGDQDAQDKLLGVTQDYLDEAKAYYASSEAYGAVYKEIENTLKATATRAETELDVAKRQAGSLLDIAANTKGLSALMAEYLSAQKAVDKAYGDVNASRDWGKNPDVNKGFVASLQKVGLSYTGNFGSGGFASWLSGLSPADRAKAASAIGYSSGGYTGAGGMFEPAGIVHRGEVVWSQPDIARWGGVRNVEAMRTSVPPITMPAMPRISGNDNAALVAEVRSLKETVAGLLRTQIVTTGGGLDRVAQTGDRTARAAEQSALADRRNTNNKQAA